MKASSLERYDRQLRIPKLGVEGQLKLRKASVLVAGIGGLGCASSISLAAAGIGRLILVDKDVVEMSNLNRQILYRGEDLGKPKAEVAARLLKSFNPDVEVKGVFKEINRENVELFVRDVDIVVDGQDNYETRFLLNETCVKFRKPFIHAAIHGLEGRLLTVIPGKGPCLRCLIPNTPPLLRPVPVLGSIAMVMGSMQAAEAIKIITGIGEVGVGKLLVVDLETLDLLSINVTRNPKCPVCGGLK
ncbi:MAG: adenylyltransferase [Thermoprotei archaeon]|nr:MAG: adenylyltransferase [Thermoprotei archaeon]